MVGAAGNAVGARADDHDGGAPGPLRCDEPPEGLGTRCVERGGGVIEDEHGGLADDRTGEG
ncbi:hypothetical protein SA2016_1886 [Sinomonas atrocyanea]|uniref:Uncharacterized protein n=1 Tax=Sinomonas atrocyanea TaxID=37927 RepID=A0A126ZZE5_9MICC|nr:hypothetical protein SA2016_1886 [Sinomonas atrocyanea]